jgi:hypothetical protein
MSFDLVVRGGTVVTASDEVRADLGVKDGRIVALGAGDATFRDIPNGIPGRAAADRVRRGCLEGRHHGVAVGRADRARVRQPLRSGRLTRPARGP